MSLNYVINSPSLSRYWTFKNIFFCVVFEWIFCAVNEAVLWRVLSFSNHFTQRKFFFFWWNVKWYKNKNSSKSIIISIHKIPISPSFYHCKKKTRNNIHCNNMKFILNERILCLPFTFWSCNIHTHTQKLEKFLFIIYFKSSF